MLGWRQAGWQAESGMAGMAGIQTAFLWYSLPTVSYLPCLSGRYTVPFLQAGMPAQVACRHAFLEAAFSVECSLPTTHPLHPPPTPLPEVSP